MSKIRTKRILLTLLMVASLAGGAVAYYLFNMPKVDVKASKADYILPASSLVNEYLNDASAADEKYLSEEGNSKIITIKGSVLVIEQDFNDQVVVKIQSPGDKAAVSCTLLPEYLLKNLTVTVGQVVTLKGVIRSGARYDTDMGMYEDVVLEKCSIV